MNLQDDEAGLPMAADSLLSTRREDWSAYLAAGPEASEDFMEGVEDLPVQDRST